MWVGGIFFPFAPQSAWSAPSYFYTFSLAASAAFFVALRFPCSFTVFASFLCSLSVIGFGFALAFGGAVAAFASGFSGSYYRTAEQAQRGWCAL